MSYRSSELWTNDPVLTPERKLWRGVLEQAYADLELPVGVESEEELLIEQIRARCFLRADTPDEKEGLRLVCDYAEVPFDRVVTWAKKRCAPSAQQDLEKVNARDAKEVAEIVKTIERRKATTHAWREFPSSLLRSPELSPLLQ